MPGAGEELVEVVVVELELGDGSVEGGGVLEVLPPEEELLEEELLEEEPLEELLEVCAATSP